MADSAITMEDDVGNWEKHTKGIGSKLLLRMGYQPGKGLGRQLQGIATPIIPKLRMGRIGIGSYLPEEETSIAVTETFQPKNNNVVERAREWVRQTYSDQQDGNQSNSYINGESTSNSNEEIYLLHQQKPDVFKCINKLRSQKFSLDQYTQIFKDLKQRNPEEFNALQLDELSLELVTPLVISALADWLPLIFPSRHVKMFTQWKEILAKPQQHENCMETQPYDRFLRDTWMPVFEKCANSWYVKDCNGIIEFLGTWKPVLTQTVLDYAVDNLIMPRLIHEVNSWNPIIDIVPINWWIHPWAPLLSSKPIYSQMCHTILAKFAIALQTWDPSDQSARIVLKHWQTAVTQEEFRLFLTEHVVPKLELCMQSLIIKPHEQNLAVWNWVMDWSDMLPVDDLTLILDKHFFPKWLESLTMWLDDNPDYHLITRWYLGWKRLFTDELLAQPSIKKNFCKALEIITQVTNARQPGVTEFVSYLISMETDGTETL